MRWGLLLLLAACGARVEDNSTLADGAAPDPDVATLLDSGIDTPPDARPCTGGDAAMQATDGSCIVLFNAPLSFAAADAACIAFGARLAILNSAERDATAQTLAGATGTLFIGLTDQDAEGTFTWVDGTPLVFKNFGTGEPNNANGAFEEDCAMYSGARAAWDDRPCSNAVLNRGATPGEYPYLCLF